MAEELGTVTDAQKFNGCVAIHGRHGRIEDGLLDDTVEINTNVHEGQPIETDGLVGKVLLMHRPSDVDADFPGKEHLTEIGQIFEFRLQARFKRPINGDLKLCVEAQVEPLSYFASIAVHTVLTVAKMISAVKGSNFDYSAPDAAGGKFHLEWSARIEVDSLTRTEAGEEPPPLTDSFPFLPVEERPSEINDVDTYTFIYWTNFYDPGRWMISNIPGMYDTQLEYAGISACHFLVQDDEGVFFDMKQEPVAYSGNKELTQSIVVEEKVQTLADQQDLDLD
jgi:hypothetical protein